MSPATVVENGDWFERTGTPRDDLPVCLGVKHPRTGRYGDVYTPREDTLTACGKTWDKERHMTLVRALATCEVCKATPLSADELAEIAEEMHERTLDRIALSDTEIAKKIRGDTGPERVIELTDEQCESIFGKKEDP